MITVDARELLRVSLSTVLCFHSHSHIKRENFYSASPSVARVHAYAMSSNSIASTDH